jgi:hypothetical protein
MAVKNKSIRKALPPYTLKKQSSFFNTHVKCTTELTQLFNCWRSKAVDDPSCGEAKSLLLSCMDAPFNKPKDNLEELRSVLNQIAKR